jgi:excisionase family DNA binding protein
MNNNQFNSKSSTNPLLRPGEVARKLGVSLNTLRRWEREGRIITKRTHGNHRRFDENAIVVPRPTATTNTPEPPERKRYAYCRVSSSKQKDDLERQVKSFQETHPDHEIVSDVGSGLNFKRKGLLRLVDEIMRGHVEEIVVSHKDRLCRFAYELIEWICHKHKTTLVVKNQEIYSAERELSEDLMAIVHVFSCRHHGMRRYSKSSDKVSEDSSLSDNQPSQNIAPMDESGQGHVQPGTSSH